MKDKQDFDLEISDGETVKTITVESDESDFRAIEEGEKLGVLALRNMVLLPGVIMPISVGREISLRLVRTAANKPNMRIAVCCQKDSTIDNPAISDLYEIGTSAKVLRCIENPADEREVIAIIEGQERVQLLDSQRSRVYLKATVHPLEEEFPRRNDKEFLAMVTQIKETGLQLIENSHFPEELASTIKNLDNLPSLLNYMCVNVPIEIEKKQALLEEKSLKQRAILLLEQLNVELEKSKIRREINEKTTHAMNKQQREFFLQQEIQTIQRELGDTNEETLAELREKASQKLWDAEIGEIFEKEVKKLERMAVQMPEYSIQLNYLETMLNLPWNYESGDDAKDMDIKNVRRILDRDHYGMEKIKERILEYLSVAKVKGDLKAPILCLYGPPGVGKTSLGKSIAEALGRKYARISLGGLHDEAEIRGHRRTYIGAMPGRIIQNLAKVKTANPVFVLDEIDKMSKDYHGDPTSALLEVLDPEQNTTFHDNYLDIDYDLSKVLFIATANSLSSIPQPLLDRMELVEMSGYLQEEKLEIAARHLVPKQLKAHGLGESDELHTYGDLHFSTETLNALIDNYTRESGVRELDRQIAAVIRKCILRMTTEEAYNQDITKDDLETYLGKAKYSRDRYEDNRYVGVVTGLAWTQVGGEILFIETSLSKAKTPALTLTGNLGDVMKESATIALGYIKAHADDFGIDTEKFDNYSVHLHVPEGAIPKDGPSAGITMTTALVSAFTGKKVRDKLAMTGEMTLRGKVLPVGGIKEKILAAKRAGITDIMLCYENQKDIEEIPQQYVNGLQFHYVHDIADVINYALV